MRELYSPTFFTEVKSREFIRGFRGFLKIEMSD